MKYILDTNVYFAILHEPDYLERYREVLGRIGPRTYLSSVVRSELLQGARGDLGRTRVRRATLTLDRTGRLVTPADRDWDTSGAVQGRIWDEHPSRRTKRLQNDLLIACTARRIGATIVSDKLNDFRLIGLYLPHRRRSMAALAAEVQP